MTGNLINNNIWNETGTICLALDAVKVLKRQRRISFADKFTFAWAHFVYSNTQLKLNSIQSPRTELIQSQRRLMASEWQSVYRVQRISSAANSFLMGERRTERESKLLSIIII